AAGRHRMGHEGLLRGRPRWIHHLLRRQRREQPMILCLGTTPTVQRTMSFARLTVDDVNRAKSVRQFASGKSVNAARVLKALGEPCVATGLLGGDSGKFMREDLDRVGIAHDFVDTSPTATRLCLTLLDESNHTATELIE